MLLDFENGNSGVLHSPSPPASPSGTVLRLTGSGGGAGQPPRDRVSPARSASASNGNGNTGGSFTPPSNYIDRADRTVRLRRG